MAGRALAVFLLDLFMDALMLILALRLGNRKLRPVRILAGAAVGAAIAYAAESLPLQSGQALLWPIAALGLMVIADGRAAALRPVRSTLLLFSAAGLLGGVVLALYGAVGNLGAAYALAAAAALMLAAGVCRERRSAADVRALRIVIRVRGSEAAFDALCDSGNCLRDYLTHKPVIVLPEGSGRKKLLLPRLRPIFADTAGGRQIMWAFTPQSVQAMRGRETTALSAVVALSPGLRDASPALVPASLLGGDLYEGTNG